MRKVLSLLASASLVVVLAACAEAVNTGTDDPPLTSGQPNEPPTQQSQPNTTPTAPPARDAGGAKETGTTTQQDAALPPLDATPDVGPPPPDAATGGGGTCNMNDPLYVGKAIFEIQKSSPRQCANGCAQNECCFWVYQVCVDL
jgi:hypothetical protein